MHTSEPIVLSELMFYFQPWILHDVDLQSYYKYRIDLSNPAV